MVGLAGRGQIVLLIVDFSCIGCVCISTFNSQCRFVGF